jgi:23S rRNA pseudouridine2604 synthase
MPERINKFLSEHGICSRREADRLITAGRVKINDRLACPGDKVSPSDDVQVDNISVDQSPSKIYILLNKPIGLITTTDQNKPDNVIKFIGLSERIFPIGRLDVQSSGLLILTNDGRLANKLTHPRFEHEKEYDVTIAQPFNSEQIKLLKTGVRLSDGLTLPTKVKTIGTKHFQIILREGRNRQIRRMCETVGLKVQRLHRIRVHTLKLGNLANGCWRYLTKKEISSLLND